MHTHTWDAARQFARQADGPVSVVISTKYSGEACLIARTFCRGSDVFPWKQFAGESRRYLKTPKPKGDR